MRTPVSARLTGFLAALLLPGAVFSAEPHFRHYVVGNPADVVTGTQGVIVMQGGGTDVDMNYVRMGELSGGGDFVVLRASGAGEYNDYILGFCNCDSVETIVLDDRDAASDHFVADTVRRAEALFITGGDQSRYLRFLKGTPVEDAIHHVAAKPAPLGGTSAGMAIMGEYVYSALGEASLTPAAALGDPYHPDLTLARDFLALPALDGIITDQHLVERDRIGRTVAMLARLVADGWEERPRAIAADRETAVHIDPASGAVTVHATPDHATPYVYFLEGGGNLTVERGRPLAVDGVAAYRLSPGGTFDLGDWQGNGGIAYTLRVVDGELVSSRDVIY